jgi:hypothetical protein
MLLEHCNHTFGGVDSVNVGWGEVDVHMVASDMRIDGLGTFIVHTLNVGEYPLALRLASMSVNAAIMVYFFPGEPIDYAQNPTIVGFSFSSPTSLRWEVFADRYLLNFVCESCIYRRKYPTSVRVFDGGMDAQWGRSAPKFHMFVHRN